MRVVIFTQYFPPEVGATQTRMETFAKYLVEAGHRVTVITEVPNHPAGVIAPGYRGKALVHDTGGVVDVVRVWVLASAHRTAIRRMAFYGSYMVAALLAAVFAVRGKVDVVFSTSPPLLVPVAGWLFSRVKRCPHVLDVRDLWPEVAVAVGELQPGRLERFLAGLARFLYYHSALVTVTTRAFARAITAAGVDPLRVVFLPNGTLPDLFSPSVADSALRRELGLDGKFVVTYAGLHGVAQGLDTVLDAARMLSAEGEVAFLLIGEGPVKAELVRRAKKEGLRNVHFLPEVPLERAARYLASSDALLVPLRPAAIFSGFVPSKLFDCMAVGRPVILSVDGEAREILDQAQAGLFVQPGSTQGLVDAIGRLRGDPDLRHVMGEGGRRYVLEHFVRARQAQRLEELLNQLLHDRQAVQRAH